jgi:hypothetical protein
MKKLCILLLLFVLVTGCLYSCQEPHNPDPSGSTPPTEATPSNSPAGEGEHEDLKLSLTAKRIDVQEENPNWKDDLNALMSLPEALVEYEILLSHNTPNSTNVWQHLDDAIITTHAELDALFCGTDLTAQHADWAVDLYKELQTVDYTQKTVVIISDFQIQEETITLKNIVSRGNAIIVSCDSDHTGDFANDEMTYWGYILLIDREVLPSAGNATDIYHCIRYPNITDPELQASFPSYPSETHVARRYLFVPLED